MSMWWNLGSLLTCFLLQVHAATGHGAVVLPAAQNPPAERLQQATAHRFARADEVSARTQWNESHRVPNANQVSSANDIESVTVQVQHAQPPK